MLFDEPTSALDPEMVGEVLQVMKDLAREHILYDDSLLSFPDVSKADVYRQGYEKWLKYTEALSTLFRR